MKLSFFSRRRSEKPPPLPAHCQALQTSLDEPVRRAWASLCGFFPHNGPLVTATLQRTAVFCQRLPSGDGDQSLFDAACAQALSRLMRLPAPSDRWPLPVADWRYLVLSRAVLDALESTLPRWQVMLFDRAGCVLGEWHPTDGPMSATARAVYYRVLTYQTRSGSTEPRRPLPGLGAVLAPVLLPPAGLDLLVGACRQGVRWLESAAFWAAWSPPAPAPAATCPPPAADAVRARSQAVTPAARKPASPVGRAGPPAGRSAQHAGIDGCQTALQTYIQTLAGGQTLNRVPGSGWVAHEALYLLAKDAADALRHHPALADRRRQFQRNTVLYRALVAYRLTQGRGDKPVWNLTVSASGESRRVAALKIPLASLTPAIAGTLPPFTGTLDLNGQPLSGPSPPAATGSPPPGGSSTASPLPYATLFNEP